MMGCYFLLIISALLCGFVLGWPEGCNIIVKNKCYEVFTTKKYYVDASKSCAKRDGLLAKISNSNISHVLATEMRRALQCHTSDHSTNRFWIGLNDQQLEGEFFFSDGSSLSALSYTAWAPGEPDNNELDGFSDCDCVSMSAFSELWFDEFCYGHARGYICEYEGKSCNVRDLNIPNGDYGYCYEDLNVTFGTMYTIVCDEGYVLDGSETVVCKGDGIWSEIPRCRRGCRAPPKFSDAKLVTKATQYFMDTELMFLCEDNFYTNESPSRSHFVITCSKRSTWLPAKTGCFRREHHTVQKVNTKGGHDAQLKCHMKDGDQINSKESNTVTWMKDSLAIYNNSTEFMAFPNGTLKIINVTKYEEGVYFCYKSDDKIIPGDRFYDLRMATENCKIKISPLKIYSVQEGRSALLLCPHSHHYTSIEWYKDKTRLSSGNKIIIFGDGSLLIRQVDQNHKGNYTCRMIKKDTLCTQNHTLELNIVIAAQHVCGNLTLSGNQPWTVSLWWDDEKAPFCYGALIKENWVVTSATCLKGHSRKRKLKAHVRFGQQVMYIERDISMNKNQTNFVPIASVKSHPKFTRRPYMYDVGLVHLKRPVAFTNEIQPVCLTDADLTVKFQCDRSLSVEGTVSGWGPLNDKSESRTKLQQELVQLVSPTLCNRTDMFYTDSLLCAKVENSILAMSEEHIVSDIGSPFTVQWKGRMYLLGIYTWGQRLARLGQYDYFTKIPLFSKWIQSETE